MEARNGGNSMRQGIHRSGVIALSGAVVLCAALPARGQNDARGTWVLEADAAGVGVVTACVTDSGAVVVHGTGQQSASGTIEYASGTVDANGRLDLTVRTLNSSTGTDKTRTFDGVLDAGSGLGSGDVTLTDTSGPDIDTTWTGVRSSSSNLCTGPGAVPVSLAVPSLPRAIVGFAYSAALAGKGGIPPLVLSVSGLPSALSFDPATNLIGGTPDAGTTGTYVLDITVTDDVGHGDTGQLVLVVGASSTPSGSGTTTVFSACGTIGMASFLGTFAMLGALRLIARGSSNRIDRKSSIKSLEKPFEFDARNRV